MMEERKKVTEYCANCETEVELVWDVDTMGYMAFCPFCGERLMLCDECSHPDGEFKDTCDYCSFTDTCKHNTEPDEEFLYILTFVRQTEFVTDLYARQLRALWTAYCFHKNLTVDTAHYDIRCGMLWDCVKKEEEDTAYWHNYDTFDGYICELMV